jgi:hypothetical protein
MSDVTYQFLPWLRAGLATQLPREDTLSDGVSGRARMDVGVRVIHSGDPIDLTRKIQVSGPGDVVGIDRRQVIRTDPKPSASDFEPNFLAIVEFDRPDFRGCSRRRPRTPTSACAPGWCWWWSTPQTYAWSRDLVTSCRC